MALRHLAGDLIRRRSLEIGGVVGRIQLNRFVELLERLLVVAGGELLISRGPSMVRRSCLEPRILCCNGS
jgi:hypothetical protein